MTVHGTIEESCTAEDEIIVTRRIANPGDDFHLLTVTQATYIVDNYIFTYNISCYQDP